MSNISFLFATIVANVYGYSPHFCYIVKSIPKVPASVQSALRNKVFFTIFISLAISFHTNMFFLAVQT